MDKKTLNVPDWLEPDFGPPGNSWRSGYADSNDYTTYWSADDEVVCHGRYTAKNLRQLADMLDSYKAARAANPLGQYWLIRE